MDYRSFSEGRIGKKALWTALVALCISIGFGVSPGGASAAPAKAALPNQTTRLYSATGHTLKGAFLDYFDKYGGVRIFGYPISEELQENGRTVQYFERQRFEFYPEAGNTPNVVQGSRLGAAIVKGRVSTNPIAPFTSTSTRIYFKETGHSLSAAFLDYWRYNGDVRIFGYPMSEMVTENGSTVQYFERARMEYHPQKASAGYGVELGQLGKEYVQAHPEIAAKVNQPAAGVTPAAPQQPTQPGVLSAREQQLLAYINGARQSAGRSPVAADSRLNVVARSRSNDMAARGYFSHVTPEGKNFMDFLRGASISFSYAGEIIATNNYRAEETVYNAYTGFMNSPTHKAIILDARYTLAGVGEAKDSRGYYFFTVDFIQK